MNLNIFTSISSEPTEGEPSIDFNQILYDIVHWLSTNGVKLLLGLIGLFICFKIINFISNRVNKIMLKRNVDLTATKITQRFVKIGLKLLVFMLFLSFVGIDTAGIGAAIASLAVTIGLALQGSLSNIAGGIVILITRPFKVGDLIETGDIIGTVDDIRAFHTIVITPDNKVVTLPNGALSNSNIINHFSKKIRRLDLVFSISYDDDFKKAQEIILDLAKNNPKVLVLPEPSARVSEHGASAINITAKLWVNSENYYDTKFEMLEEVKTAFDKNNITIPFNQMDVHLDQKNSDK